MKVQDMENSQMNMTKNFNKEKIELRRIMKQIKR